MDLHELWQQQFEQQLSFYNLSSLTTKEQSIIVKELLVGLYEEVGELSRAADQDRYHLLKRPELVKSNIIEEGVDVFKMLMSVLQVFGITPDEFIDTFTSKTAIVQQKWQAQHIQLEKETKVFATDLDGCVVDMDEFMSYLKGIEEPGDQRKTVEALEAVKERFYVNGGFLTLPPIDGAVEGLAAIRDMGYKIIIVTARPHWQYRRLHGDTAKWLEKHGVAYDHIIFNKDKAEAVWEDLHPARPTWFVEDRLKHMHELLDVGVPVLLFDTPKNQGELPAMARRVHGWDAIVAAARDSLNG